MRWWVDCHGRESRDFYGNSHEENGGVEVSIRTSFSGNSMSMHLFKLIISHAAYADFKTQKETSVRVTAFGF